MTSRAVLFGAALVAWAPAGCGHRSAGPAETAAVFGAAIERGDLAAAYALTSADTRKRLPYPAFTAAFAAAPAEAKAFGRRLAAEAPRQPLRVEIPLPLGDVLPLVYEDGRWRVDGAGFDPWGQGTPRAALRSFIRALDERRYDVLMRLVPDRYRGELTIDKLRQYWEQERKEEHVALLARLKAAVGAPIVESGDEAHMPYGPDAEVHFVREGGRWKIEDPD